MLPLPVWFEYCMNIQQRLKERHQSELMNIQQVTRSFGKQDCAFLPSGHCCESVSVTQMSVRFYGKQLKLLMAKNSIQL